MDSRDDAKQNEIIDNDHQKTVSGKKQSGPDEKLGKGAGGNAGSKGQNLRAVADRDRENRRRSIIDE
jgi:hypothetical protein